jgi:CdiI N-terminal domain
VHIQDQMSFSIRFLEIEPRDPMLAHGELVLDGHIENFSSCTNSWNMPDYKRQWQHGIKRIIDGENKSCLIVSLHEPGFSDFLILWPMYRINDQIVFQEQWLPSEKVAPLFDPARPYEYIGDWITMSDDGEKLSEWWIKLSDVVGFFQRTNWKS